MNEQQFENKMEKDGARVKKAADQMADDGTSHLREGLNDFTGSLKSSAKEAVSSMKHDVNVGMKQYNSKAQQIADKLHLGMSHNLSEYPWVVISLGLVFGFMLGIMLKPSQQSR